ncbi:MAG: NAD(+) synthase [bacterium]
MKMPATIRICLAQMEIQPGRPADNTHRILQLIGEARAAGAEVIAFPEMAVPGYLLGDEWERNAFLRDCEACGEEIRNAADGLLVIFGNVGVDRSKVNEDGRVRKYNACFVAENRTFLKPDNSLGYDFVIKTLMPNYREFDDSRHFYDIRKLAIETGKTPNDLVAPVRTARFSIGCVLCEDGWDLDYGISPLRILGTKGADFFVNISCSPYTVNKNHKRNRVFSDAASELHRPLAYVNNTGIQNNGKTIFTFDGQSCIYDGFGNQASNLEPFKEGVLEIEMPLGGGKAFGTPISLTDDSIGDMYRAISYGTKRFLSTCGISRVVIGGSGGIDSSLVAAIYSQILSAEDILIVNMPSRHNSAITRNLAAELARNLGCFYADIPIEDSVLLTSSQVSGLHIANADGKLQRTLKLSSFMLENVQARDRSSRLLAALAASFGGAFTCNANKSEMTVGYTTLYGDLGGYVANIADIWKGEVYAMSKYMNEEVFCRKVIPQGCFDIVPSAELSPDQNIEMGKGDPLIYPYHDCLFRSWVEAWNRTTPEEALEWYLKGTLEQNIGYEGKTAALFPDASTFINDLERWWTQYQGMGIAKRIQAPPVLAIKRRAFGFDHREAQLGTRYTRRYKELKQKALGK